MRTKQLSAALKMQRRFVTNNRATSVGTKQFAASRARIRAVLARLLGILLAYSDAFSIISGTNEATRARGKLIIPRSRRAPGVKTERRSNSIRFFSPFISFLFVRGICVICRPGHSRILLSSYYPWRGFCTARTRGSSGAKAQRNTPVRGASR